MGPKQKKMHQKKTMTSKILLHKLIRDMPSSRYHSVRGTYSSSQLKDLLDDPNYFKRKWIDRTIESEHLDAFDLGTYVHSSILEPENLSVDCVVYPGKIRRGKEWDSFKELHTDKAIITEDQKVKADSLIAAIRDSKIAMDYVDRGTSEVSIFVKIIVDPYGTIYSPKMDSVMTNGGWEKAGTVYEGTTLVLKVRADSLGDGYVLDVKTTTGNARSEKSMKQKVSAYNYDLSASLYLDMFTAGTGNMYKDFIWTFASKDYGNCKSYKASVDNIRIGRAKWTKAIRLLAQGIENKWHETETLGTLEPEYYQYEYLKET